MQKLLIAERDSALRQALSEALADDFLITACADGAQARQALSEFRPDLVILNLLLPHVDGLTLLRELSGADISPAVAVTTPFVSPYILDALGKLRVDHLTIQPYSVQALREQLLELAETRECSAVRTTPAPRAPLPTLLLELGLSPKVDGFGHLLTAIPLYLRDPAQGLTKELYAAVGRSCGKSAQQVERSIRNAIQNAWTRGSSAQWLRYFPALPDGTVPRPTNGDFIARIATRIFAQNGTFSCAPCAPRADAEAK